MVSGYPEGSLCAAKVPQVITHEKVMQDWGQDVATFLKVMSGLKEKLGPLLLQFPYFNKKAFESPQHFYTMLGRFLAGLPKEFQWALKIRNKYWITEELLELLSEHSIAFTMLTPPESRQNDSTRQPICLSPKLRQSRI
jgi:uncharacterized protein YecE (DUF72 family)